MNNPTMLYRCPGPETFEGVKCETTIVDEPDVEATLADGWHRTWPAADEAHKAAAEKLAANEAEQRDIEQKLGEAGQSDGAGASKSKAAKKDGAGASK